MSPENGTTPLGRRIRRHIRAAGPIPFARFMESALYDPDWGYYERRLEPTGKAGDFFTSVAVGPLFGQLLAFRFCRWFERLDQPRVHLIEAGAHDGRLAADILGGVREFAPHWFDRIEYWILEPSERRAARQQSTLAAFLGRVRWARHWRDRPAPGWTGILFANELLDSFPVRRLGWHAPSQSWYEWGVGLHANRLVWHRLPLGADQAHRALDGFFRIPKKLSAAFPDGFVVEVAPGARAWWIEAAASLERGWLLTFDYGLDAEAFLDPARSAGTLRAYRHHTQIADVLNRPGEQDLTSHVNFTALRQAGEAAGLTTEFAASQGDFLARVLAEIEAVPGRFPDWTAARRRQLATLLHPEHLGSAFRVLVQNRPCPTS